MFCRIYILVCFDIVQLWIIVFITSFDKHYIDEPDMEIGKPMNCNVVVNRHVELTEEEKAEQKALALKRFQEDELRKLQTAHSKPKTVKPQPAKQPELSLFDF